LIKFFKIKTFKNIKTTIQSKNTIMLFTCIKQIYQTHNISSLVPQMLFVSVNIQHP